MTIEEAKQYLAANGIGWDSLDISKRSITDLIERGWMTADLCLDLAEADLNTQAVKALHRASPLYPNIKLRDEQ